MTNSVLQHVHHYPIPPYGRALRSNNPRSAFSEQFCVVPRLHVRAPPPITHTEAVQRAPTARSQTFCIRSSRAFQKPRCTTNTVKHAFIARQRQPSVDYDYAPGEGLCASADAGAADPRPATAASSYTTRAMIVTSVCPPAKSFIVSIPSSLHQPPDPADSGM